MGHTYISTDTRTGEQIEALNNGTAVIKDFVLLKPEGVGYLSYQL